MTAKIAAGQVQAQAPLDYIKGDRQRVQDGRYVKGAWADPWWAYSPEAGWAVVKVWRQREQVTIDWRAGAVRGERVEIPAAEEIVLQPVAA
jgi:hypothetical protein